METTTPAGSDDAEVTQALIGTWVWMDESSGEPTSNRLTLAADGTYSYTNLVETDEVTATGVWYYHDGWLQFRPEWVSSSDPTAERMVQGPIQVLEIGPDFVRTPAGLALHAA